MTNFNEVFQKLAGEWKLAREISSGERFTGTANFKRLSNRDFLLAETGTLHMIDGNTIEATRQWHWSLKDDNNLIVSYNETPLRTYHEIHLTIENLAWWGTADHLCAPDTYSGKYKFDENEILIKQTIKGPNKDYIVRSKFSRY